MQIASLDVCLPRLVLLLASHVCQMLAAGHAETQDPVPASWVAGYYYSFLFFWEIYEP